MTDKSLYQSLAGYGLHVLAVTRLSDDEAASLGIDDPDRALALVGNIGSSYWPFFSASPEYRDAAAHPLDRWSQRIAAEIADPRALQPLFPFEGPPWLPFQRWAERAGGLTQSPIGVMMHPEYGLWHSYRFALRGARFEVPASGDESPCLSCTTKPCLNTCPVDAFDASGYAVDRCADYLGRDPEAGCHQQGCLARYACPVAPELRYDAAQGRFHLNAFLGARPAAG